jgi:hypothetical protein
MCSSFRVKGTIPARKPDPRSPGAGGCPAFASRPRAPSALWGRSKIRMTLLELRRGVSWIDNNSRN